MTLKLIKNKRGFSLIELMIVVAIIGILSAIAIPNYTRFKKKAQQSEAHTNLETYYMAAKAATAEHGYNKGNFGAVGFQPEGRLGYRITALETSGGQPDTYTESADTTTCIDTVAATVCAAGFQTWTEDTVHTFAPTAVATNTGVAWLTVATTCLDGVAGGVCSAKDEWTINTTKALTNSTPGI